MSKSKCLFTIDSLPSGVIGSLIDRALQLKKGAKPNKRKDLFVANLFFENSTRTKLSFEVAQNKLGMKILDFKVETSSVNKGESLYDTCKTLEAIGVDILVIRHPKISYFEELKNIKIPIINAGDGSGEHPTQSLLDLTTIFEKFKTFQDLRVLIVGDIKHSRVAHSNYKVLKRLGATVKLVAPIFLKDEFGSYVDLDSHLAWTDILYLLRIQEERLSTQESQGLSKEEFHKQYGLNTKRYALLKENAVIMHPAPVNRNIEIEDELVESPKSLIFTQMENGMYLRMALLEWIIKINNL